MCEACCWLHSGWPAARELCVTPDPSPLQSEDSRPAALQSELPRVLLQLFAQVSGGGGSKSRKRLDEQLQERISSIVKYCIEGGASGAVAPTIFSASQPCSFAIPQALSHRAFEPKTSLHCLLSLTLPFPSASVSSLEVPAVVHMLASPNANILKRALQQVRPRAGLESEIINRFSAVQCFLVTNRRHRGFGARISCAAINPGHATRRLGHCGAEKLNTRPVCVSREAYCRISQVI